MADEDGVPASEAVREPATESELVRVTAEDISAANQLSLSCPICAGAVERHAADSALAPVFCLHCQTLYHQTCWDQNGSKCAVLGCNHREARPYGAELGPVLKIGYGDIPRVAPPPPRAPNGRVKELKRQERRRQQEAAQRDFWNSLLRRILRAFGWQSGRS
jgi:hypothetical protein